MAQKTQKVLQKCQNVIAVAQANEKWFGLRVVKSILIAIKNAREGHYFEPAFLQSHTP